MKSMLHEASSVLKAIQKAWDEAGQPDEFTIKILEKGLRGFLGFVKAPAVVSITYGHKKNNVRPIEPKRSDQKVAVAQKDSFKDEKTSSIEKSAASKQNAPTKNVKKSSQPVNAQGEIKRDKDRTHGGAAESKQVEVEVVTWQQDHIDYVQSMLMTMLNTMEMQATPSIKVDQKMLQITLHGVSFDQKEDERSFCMSLSYLLIQFLKKQFKKKLRGYQLHIALKAS